MTAQTTRPHGGTNHTGTGDTCATSPAGSSPYGHAAAIQATRPAVTGGGTTGRVHLPIHLTFTPRTVGDAVTAGLAEWPDDGAAPSPAVAPTDNPAAPPSTTYAPIYRLAADLIRQRGWCQGLASFGDRICAGRALILAATLLGYDWLAGRGALDYLTARVQVPHISAWNDAVGRTVHDVLAALEQAAVDAEAGHA